MHDPFKILRRINETNNSIKKTTIGETVVSTVWLFDIAHGHNAAGEPLIYETMIFYNHNNENDAWCTRYATKEEAMEGHDKIVRGYLNSFVRINI